ncbi:MAG: hypothetical protein R6U38_02280 [Desulfatiglandaceae bacterium]
MPNPALNESLVQNWRQFMENVEKSLDLVEEQLNEASEMTEICTSEWCEATEHVIDDLSNFLFSISMPRGASEEDSKRLKTLKKRLHDLYAQYKSTAG